MVRLEFWSGGPKFHVENWSPGQFFHSTSLENWSASGKMVRSIKYCSLLAFVGPKHRACMDETIAALHGVELIMECS